jgi:hypothetical protein
MPLLPTPAMQQHVQVTRVVDWMSRLKEALYQAQLAVVNSGKVHSQQQHPYHHHRHHQQQLHQSLVPAAAMAVVDILVTLRQRNSRHQKANHWSQVMEVV